VRAFRKAGARTWQVRLYDGARAVDRSLETRDRASAAAIVRSLERVAERPALAPLWRALLARTLSPVVVWEADRAGTLEALVASLAAVDLAPLVDDWYKALEGKVADDTRAHYRHAVRLLVAAGTSYPSHLLTDSAVQDWLDGMEDVSPSTVRKRGMGMRRFTEWLVRVRKVLEVDPMARVELPAQAGPLTHYLETADAERLADAQPGQFRLLAMLLPGSAIEVSVALALRVRNVLRLSKEIHAPGTKAYSRDRVVRVAEWAWPAVLELVKGKHPDALLFDRIRDRWEARDAHAAAVEALASKGHLVYVRAPDGTAHAYTMRDHRHTWAVRAVRSGWPLEVVSRQLGHANGVLALKVYGRWVPSSDERAKWEAMATVRDAEMANQRKAEEVAG
jgi:integrase